MQNYVSGYLVDKIVYIFEFEMMFHAETVCMAAELREEGITIISQNPGWVQTDMGNYCSDKMGGEVKPPLDAPTSISKQLAIFEKLTLADTGKFIEVTGEPVPW